MSIDLSNFDIYNYEFFLRPDSQTATIATNAQNVESVSNDNLKPQFMNIPSQYNVSPAAKVYFYLRDISINNRDALAIYSEHLQDRHYFQIKAPASTTIQTLLQPLIVLGMALNRMSNLGMPSFP